VKLEPAAETLLRHMAEEHPLLDLADAAEETGLAPAVAETAMLELCDAGYAKQRTPPQNGWPNSAVQFDITASGRRTASRL
jgi:hypothetical protein